jgi:hypothetical protein
MIVREEFDRYRFDGPRPVPVPWYRPIGINEPFDSSKVTYDIITFTPEIDPQVHDLDVYVKVWDVPFRWVCQDCVLASGDYKDVFHTKWAKRENLGGKGNRNFGGFSEPTYVQQLEMQDHARQHAIMYSWAKGLK